MTERVRVKLPRVIATGPGWSQVNIDSINGLVPSGNQPLLEPKSTHYFVAL